MLRHANKATASIAHFYEAVAAPALATSGRRNWSLPVFGRNWRTRLHRLKWRVLSGGVQADSPDLLIAAARCFLALASLLAIWLDSTEPAGLATTAHALLLFYLTYSVAIFVFERTAKNSARYALLIHAASQSQPKTLGGSRSVCPILRR